MPNEVCEREGKAKFQKLLHEYQRFGSAHAPPYLAPPIDVKGQTFVFKPIPIITSDINHINRSITEASQMAFASDGGTDVSVPVVQESCGEYGR